MGCHFSQCCHHLLLIALPGVLSGDPGSVLAHECQFIALLGAAQDGFGKYLRVGSGDDPTTALLYSIASTRSLANNGWRT